MAAKHPRQESLFTKAGTARKRRPRTFRRGKRPGRPKKRGARLRHARRPELSSRYPVHATWRIRRGLPNLRGPREMAAIRAAFRRGKVRRGELGEVVFRLVHFSVQKNHVHMLCEAANETALARGLQGLAVRFARGLNRAIGRKGKVLDDRYHSRILKSPRETRWALGYVLCNTRRHGAELLTPKRYPRRWLDAACSSAEYFPGWHDRGKLVGCREVTPDAPITEPTTWLLERGWLLRGGGKLPTDHIPGTWPRAG